MPCEARGGAVEGPGGRKGLGEHLGEVGGEQEEEWGEWGGRRASSDRLVKRGPPGSERVDSELLVCRLKLVKWSKLVLLPWWQHLRSAQIPRRITTNMRKQTGVIGPARCITTN